MVAAVVLAALLGAALVVTLHEDRAVGQGASRTADATADGLTADGFVETADRFVDAWGKVSPGKDVDDWHRQVAALATPDLASALAGTAPTALPGAGADGHPRLRFVSDSSALVVVPLKNGQSVAVTVVKDGDRMLVSDIQPDVGDYGTSS